ncbi:LOW QUALITY PROTEIN: hypothetical protein TorRG33x02_065060, partial [Trema orientale]
SFDFSCLIYIKVYVSLESSNTLVQLSSEQLRVIISLPTRVDLWATEGITQVVEGAVEVVVVVVEAQFRLKSKGHLGDNTDNLLAAVLSSSSNNIVATTTLTSS